MLPCWLKCSTCYVTVRRCLELGAAVQDGREAGLLVLGQGVRAAGDAAAAPVRVPVQVGLERVELARARSLPAPVCEFLPGSGAGSGQAGDAEAGSGCGPW
jgi:hypothetical protein